MPRFLLPAVLALSGALAAQTGFFPLSEVKPGMRGTGRTVFSGDRIEEFQVEVLGVLDNAGPKQSLVLARLSGGPLEHAGVMQGMSGSPVYIDGRLLGAVAMAFPYAKDPIAGIRPIEDMVRGAAAAAADRGGAFPNGRGSDRNPVRVALGDGDLLHLFPRAQPAMAGDERMMDIATPISFGGFSRGTLEVFAPQLRSLGLEPRQAVTSGGKLSNAMGNPADLKPGSMISVQLMAGDLSVGADGTVTYIDGNRVYAFGHRFLAVGATALPFARSEVIALLPALNSSFKLSSAKEWMGGIYQDRDTAVSGELGQLPALTPMSISVSRNGRPIESYRMQLVNDPLLSPLLIQMAVSSAIDATERAVGASSVRISGEIEFRNAPTPVQISSLFAMDNGSAAQASLAAAIPAAYAMQSGYDAFGLKRVDLAIEVYDQKKELRIDGVAVSRREARPGDAIRLDVSLAGDNGLEVTRQVEYQTPIGMEPGTLYFTVADAASTNIADFRQTVTAEPRDAGQVIAMLNGLHRNTKAYVRVWSASPAFQLEGADLPDPPASVALILGRSQTSYGGITQTRNSKIAEIEIDAGDMSVTGSKTVQVEIKE